VPLWQSNGTCHKGTKTQRAQEIQLNNFLMN
jgi:hypothetical protein